MPLRKYLLGALALAVVGAGGFWWHVRGASFSGGQAAAAYHTQEEASDVFVRFEMEAYDTIQQNYWMAPAQYDLPKIFMLSAQKVSGITPALATSTREAAATMLKSVFDQATSTDAKRQWAVSMLQVVLYNLIPNGRDQLLSHTQETALRQQVANVNPQKDLYGDLGLAKGASADQVAAAYAAQSKELEASSSLQAKEQLQKIAYDKQVLTNPTTKTLYDQNQAEPTVFGHVIGATLYVYVQQIAPTTLVELGSTLDSASTTPLSSLVIDLRGNIGGALDFARFFLGLFMGPNQYAFDLFHQGDYQAQRTPPQIPKIGELDRYAHMVVLTDNMSQSTAELTSSVLKRYHLATIVGTRTRGWGSVENTYELKTVIDPTTTYTLELVNSLTLGADQQPIEQNGVTPDIDTSASGWQAKVRAALPADLANAVIKMESRDPWKF